MQQPTDEEAQEQLLSHRSKDPPLPTLELLSLLLLSLSCSLTPTEVCSLQRANELTSSECFKGKYL